MLPIQFFQHRHVFNGQRLHWASRQLGKILWQSLARRVEQEVLLVRPVLRLLQVLLLNLQRYLLNYTALDINF